MGSHRTANVVARIVCMLAGGAAICFGQLPNILTSTLPPATTGGPYSVVLSVGGGTPPYSNWTVGAGSFPPGLTLNSSTGAINGIPSSSGTYNFFVTVQDSAGGISPAAALTISSSVPTITTTSLSLPGAVLNAAYTTTLTVSGGTDPYGNWTLTSGSLPQGLLLNSATGVISGTPVASGAYNFSVTVQDSTGVTSPAQNLMIVAGVAITTNSLPKGTISEPYNAPLVAAGGLAPYPTWSVSSGSLPPGLTLTGGLISGVPTASGSYSFSIGVTDSANTAAVPQPYTVVIAPFPVITTGALQPGVPGIPYYATLTATGGTLPLVWTIASGNLPPGLSFYPGTGVISGTPQTATGTAYSFSVSVTDAVGVVSAPQPLSISINQAALTVAPASLYFSARLGDTTPVPVQSVSIFSPSNTVTYSASVSTSTGGNWLSVIGGGKTPGNLLVSVTTAGLSPGTTYKGTITITGQNVATATIPVTLTTASNGPPQLSVAPSSLALSYVQGNPTDQRYLVVNNSGGGTIHFYAQPSTDSCGANWLNLLTTAGSATNSNAGVVAVLVSPSGLSDKTCTGAITISDAATGLSQRVPVTMTVSAQTQSLLLTQAGLTYQTSVGAAPPPQTFAVLNSGVGSVAWTATPQTSSGGNWLTVSPASGTATAGVIPSPVTVTLNSQGLPPGTYFGSVQIASSTVGNSPQSVSIMLTVAVTPPVPPALTPAGFILIGQSTGVSETGTTTLLNPWSTPLTYSSTAVTDNRINWLSQTPATGTIAPGGTATMSLQATLKGLSPGLQHGIVRIAFPNGTVHSIDVYLIVPASLTTNLRTTGTQLHPADVQPAAIAQSCPGSSGIALVLRSPEPGFVVTAQTPVPLMAIARDCSTGKPVRQLNGASVQVITDSGPVVLIDDGAGNWTGTWTPTTDTLHLDLAARIDEYSGAAASVITSQDFLSGTVLPAPDGAAGVVTNIFNGASFQSPGSVTPGAWVSLFGIGMADSSAAAGQTPFPSSLGGTQVLLQNQALPLYFVNSTQINALIPTGINPNERQQLVVVRNGTQSTAVDVRVAGVQPAIFTVNQQGTGQGAITVGSPAQLAAPSGQTVGARPARHGEFISIYGTGLGPVSNAPPDGSLAPMSPAATTSFATVVSIGGVTAPAIFSGLAPMQVGLYQINVQIPSSAPSGDAIPVKITVGNAVSNTATIAVQ